MQLLDNITILQNSSFINNITKIFFVTLFSYITFLRIVGLKNIKKYTYIANIIGMIIIAILVTHIKFTYNTFYSIAILTMLLIMICYINYKKDLAYTILISIISLSINYTFYIVAVMIAFFPKKIFGIENDYLNLTIIMVIYLFIIVTILKIKKFKYGIAYLQNMRNNKYLIILILNVSIIILFSIVIIQNYEIAKTGKFILIMIGFSTVLCITIKESLQLYYKQNLLIQDLEETKKELEYKKQEIEKLEKENLKFGEISHSLAHKQKSLQYKIEQIIKKNKVVKTEEIKELEERVQQISEELYVEPKDIELTKTNITIIDDMLKCMQAECIEKNIKFDLQINGNIHYLINNLIEKEKLEILLADHIKDAIIAINHSNNENKSILVKLGKFDGIYSLYIYDSGIEFEKDTLEKLGSKPITTHADTGGTGIGFMKTFNTLRQCKASLIIEEYRKPCNENYTKAIIIKFDKKQEYKVKSYRDISINKLIK